jgi:hypothetical protein
VAGSSNIFYVMHHGLARHSAMFVPNFSQVCEVNHGTLIKIA